MNFQLIGKLCEYAPEQNSTSISAKLTNIFCETALK